MLDDRDADLAPGSKMPAEFGLPTATFVIVASMVGVGVLTTSGYTVALTGSNQLMLGLWLLGGVVAACGALTLCELSAALPETGGDYVFLHEAYGPLAAFLSGWVSFLIGFAGPIAASAFASAKFLLIPLRLDPSLQVTAQRGLASVAILLFALVHSSGRSRTAWVQGVMTAVKLALLAGFVVGGLVAGRANVAHLNDLPPIDGKLLVTMMFSLVYISYAYTGWNAASFLAGEVRDPQRLLPRAILLGTFGVVLLYVGLNVVYALGLSARDVKRIVDDPSNTQGQDAVAPIAQLAARELFGPRWSDPLSVALGLMLLSSASAYILTGPRVLYAMARAGQFPAIAARLSGRSGTPAIATALQVACAGILLWTGTFDQIVVFASVGLSIFSMLTISSVYVLRWRRPDLPRPFRTPGYPVTPAIYLGFTAILTGAAFWRSWQVSSLSLLAILAGIPLYVAWRRRAA